MNKPFLDFESGGRASARTPLLLLLWRRRHVNGAISTLRHELFAILQNGPSLRDRLSGCPASRRKCPAWKRGMPREAPALESLHTPGFSFRCRFTPSNSRWSCRRSRNLTHEVRSDPDDEENQEGSPFGKMLRSAAGNHYQCQNERADGKQQGTN